MIRPFSYKDADRCREILKGCLEESVTLEGRTKLFLIKRFTAKGYIESKAEKYCFFVYERDGRILGMGGLRKNEIEKLYVEPKAHGQGVGKEILHFLEDLAKKLGYTQLVLHTFPNAIGFYEKEGYKTAGTHYYEFPEHDLKVPTIEMRKRVSA